MLPAVGRVWALDQIVQNGKERARTGMWTDGKRRLQCKNDEKEGRRRIRKRVNW